MVGFWKMYMKKISIILVSIVFILSVLLGFYLSFENTKLVVSNYEVLNSKIPVEFNDFKILQISDFHNTKLKILTNDLIREVKRQKPNIIVLTGDLIDCRKTNVDVAINFIKSINDVAPIYFVPGNHELRTGEYSKLRNRLVDNKVIILENNAEVIKLNDHKINIIGINDPSTAGKNFISKTELIKTELNHVNYDKNTYSILLSHRPEVFNTYVENKIDLILTGHAHGGQIRIPFLGGILAPSQGFFPKYASGKFNKDKTTMIVSRGIGNSIFPFRINNRPELVIVKLKSN